MTPAEYKKRFPKDDAYQQKFNAEASLFYRNKMMELIDNDPKRIREMRGYVPALELPGHLMYRLETIHSKDGHRQYEFLIEYDTDTPNEGIYYGCRGITNEGYDHEREIEQFRKDWEIVKPELCQILNNTFPKKDFSHRFRMTDNANTYTYWLFWITLNAEEDIKKVGLTATTIIRNVFQRYFSGEEFLPKALPCKNFNDEITSFTADTYTALLDEIKYIDGIQRENKELSAQAREVFEQFIHGAVNQKLLLPDPSYECAWRFMRTENTDFARMMFALFTYLYQRGLYGKSYREDESKETIEVPWAAIRKVFLNADGQTYPESIRTQVKKRKQHGDLDEEVLSWISLIQNCVNNS